MKTIPGGWKNAAKSILGSNPFGKVEGIFFIFCLHPSNYNWHESWVWDCTTEMFNKSKAKNTITYILVMYVPKGKKDIIWEAQETYTKVVPKYWLPWFSKVCVDSFWKQKVCTRSKSGRLKHFPSIGPGSKNVGGHEATQNLPASHEKKSEEGFFCKCT